MQLWFRDWTRCLPDVVLLFIISLLLFFFVAVGCGPIAVLVGATGTPPGAGVYGAGAFGAPPAAERGAPVVRR